jgi:hypothetical protein
MRLLLWNKKKTVEGGWKLKFTFVSWRQLMNRSTQIKFDTVKYDGHTYKYYLNRYFVLWAF